MWVLFLVECIEILFTDYSEFFPFQYHLDSSGKNDVQSKFFSTQHLKLHTFRRFVNLQRCNAYLNLGKLQQPYEYVYQWDLSTLEFHMIRALSYYTTSIMFFCSNNGLMNNLADTAEHSKHI